MRFTLPVTPATLPRLEELRRAARHAGGKPAVLNLPEADAARDAALREAHGPLAQVPTAPGRWLIASIGPLAATWDPSLAVAPGIRGGLVYSCEVEVLPWVAPVRMPLGWCAPLVR